MSAMPSILIIVTSVSQIAPGELTGLWLEEFAVPYLEFKTRGFKVSVASIKGGKAPIDPRSLPAPELHEAWADAIAALDNTVPISTVKSADFDAVFIPGGHGTMFDFPTSDDLRQILSEFAEQNKVIAAMCHGPASLISVRLADGTPLVAGKTVTSFTNDEESAAGFTNRMPFLLETRLRELGAKFVGQPKWSNHVEIDGQLITGQNPQSSKRTAQAVIDALTKK